VCDPCFLHVSNRTVTLQVGCATLLLCCFRHLLLVKVTGKSAAWSTDVLPYTSVRWERPLYLCPNHPEFQLFHRALLLKRAGRKCTASDVQASEAPLLQSIASLTVYGHHPSSSHRFTPLAPCRGFRPTSVSAGCHTLFFASWRQTAFHLCAKTSSPSPDEVGRGGASTQHAITSTRYAVHLLSPATFTAGNCTAVSLGIRPLPLLPLRYFCPLLSLAILQASLPFPRYAACAAGRRRLAPPRCRPGAPALHAAIRG
jgi:hypothetical protein